MILTTTETIPGYKITALIGIARGNTVRAKNIGRDIFASFRHLVGGEIYEYTKLIAESRQQSMDRLKEHAKAMGADAVINIRFTTSSISQGASEIFAYGTAVKVEKES